MLWQHPTAYVAVLWTGDTCFLRFKGIYFFNIPSPSGFELLTGAEVVSCVNPRVGDTWDLLGPYVCFRRLSGFMAFCLDGISFHFQLKEETEP